MTPGYPPTLGLVLAGGRAQRMGGGDKALIGIAGKSILERVLARLSPQCERVILNANGDPKRFAHFGLPVIADDVPDFAGPLAGLLAGLDWAARHAPDIRWVVSVPGDCPFLPTDFVARLHEARARENAPLVCASSGGQVHPVAGLWDVALRHDLRRALCDENIRKVESWAARHGVSVAEWPDRPIDPFFNVNTPEDVLRATAFAQDYGDKGGYGDKDHDAI